MRDPDVIYRLGDPDPDLSLAFRNDFRSVPSTRTAEPDKGEPDMSDVGEGTLPMFFQPKAEPIVVLEEAELPETAPQILEENAHEATAAAPSPEQAKPQLGTVVVAMLHEVSEELRQDEEMLRLQEEVLKGQHEDQEHLTSQRAKPEGLGNLEHFVEQKMLEPEQDQPTPEVSVKEPSSSAVIICKSPRQLVVPPMPTVKETMAETNDPNPPSTPPGILSPKSGGGAFLQVPDSLPRSTTNSSLGSSTTRKSVSFSVNEDPNPKKKYNYRAGKVKQEKPSSERDGVLWHLLPG